MILIHYDPFLMRHNSFIFRDAQKNFCNDLRAAEENIDKTREYDQLRLGIVERSEKV